MKKSELIHKITRKNTEIRDEDIENAVNMILEYMVSSLANGKRIEIRGFGVFQTKYTSPRMGRNPKTGESVLIIGKYRPRFKASFIILEAINTIKG